MSQNNTSSGGVGFSGLIFLILMTLKLTGYINWSWWWVTSPLWGGFAILLLVILVYVFVKSFK
jgi:hypothetical protein